MSWLYRISYLVVAGLCVGNTQASARSLTLSEAVGLALKQSPRISQAREKVGEAEARRRAARGNFGPKLGLEGKVLLWDEALNFDLPPPGPEVMQNHGPVLAKYADLMVALPDLFNFGAIRDQVIAQVTVTAVQPLTPLYTIAKGHTIARLGHDAANKDLASTKDDVIYRVTTRYIGLKQARRGVEIAKGAVKQVEAHLKRARMFQSAGLIDRNDVLKAELALAQAKERWIKVRAAAALAESALAIALGLPPETRIKTTERFADPPPRFTRSLEKCVKTARQSRPDVQAMVHRVSMADKGRDIARWDLAPQLSAIASYQRSEGMGVFTPKNAFFVGGVLKWQFWEWGAKYYGIRQAGHKLNQARIGLKQLSDGVYLQVKQSYLGLRSASQTLVVARSARTQAEESYRIAEAKFSAHTTTSTDVLDAQLALTRARLTYDTALYQWYVAHAALLKATGGWGTRSSSQAATSPGVANGK